ncbi:MAG: hypothetical protein EHM87_25405 [Burkholderiales bacterium]|nr:MAG: hypothetical protein EHM87_25405 [Burkholderiales bacterium]
MVFLYNHYTQKAYKNQDETSSPAGIQHRVSKLSLENSPLWFYIIIAMAKKKEEKEKPAVQSGKPSSLVDTRVIYCGDNLDQLKKFPACCVDLIYIDPPFNSNRNYEVFWGETKEKRAFEDRHEYMEI